MVQVLYIPREGLFVWYGFSIMTRKIVYSATLVALVAGELPCPISEASLAGGDVIGFWMCTTLTTNHDVWMWFCDG
jgi:hypothetical protein